MQSIFMDIGLVQAFTDIISILLVCMEEMLVRLLCCYWGNNRTRAYPVVAFPMNVISS